jgi:hypothetical protein
VGKKFFVLFQVPAKKKGKNKTRGKVARFYAGVVEKRGAAGTTHHVRYSDNKKIEEDLTTKHVIWDQHTVTMPGSKWPAGSQPAGSEPEAAAGGEPEAGGAAAAPKGKRKPRERKKAAAQAATPPSAPAPPPPPAAAGESDADVDVGDVMPIPPAVEPAAQQAPPAAEAPPPSAEAPAPAAAAAAAPEAAPTSPARASPRGAKRRASEEEAEPKPKPKPKEDGAKRARTAALPPIVSPAGKKTKEASAPAPAARSAAAAGPRQPRAPTAAGPAKQQQQQQQGREQKPAPPATPKVAGPKLRRPLSCAAAAGLRLPLDAPRSRPPPAAATRSPQAGGRPHRRRRPEYPEGRERPGSGEPRRRSFVVFFAALPNRQQPLISKPPSALPSFHPPSLSLSLSPSPP